MPAPIYYASYLQGLRNNAFQIDRLVSDQIDCAVGPKSGIEACRDREGGRVWARGGYTWSKVDGDAEAAAYDIGGFSGLIGGDYSFGHFTIGAFAGYRDLDFDFAAFGGQMEASGWQLGAYAAYDVGRFYARGIASYQSLDGDSARRIDFGSIAGTLDGDPDTGIWSFYAEAGARFDMGGSWITPFAAIDYTGVKLKSFAETGLPGADLDFESQTEKQFSGLLGVKWAANFGGVAPEVNLAWRHDFSDERFDLLATFADAPAGSRHWIVSPEIGKDSAIAGISLGGAFSSTITGRLGYQGRFSSDARDHALFGSLTLSFGGAGQ